MTGPARAERLARWPRALGAVPRFVARDLLLGRLMAGRDGLAEREQREALLVATLLDLSIPARAAEPWDAILPLDAAPLAALGGLSPGACAEAIERLAAAGVLLREPDAASHAGRLAADVFGVDAAGAAGVDWPAVLEALAGDAAGLLVVRALADLLRRPDRLASVTRARIAAYTLYSEGMVKRGIASAVARGVIERAQPNAYRFSDYALGRVGRAERAAPEPPPPAPAAPTPPAARQPSAPALVSFTAAGIPLELPRDTVIELEGNVGGQPTRLRIRFPSE
ncbi:MAG TPA: hypothetical protein VKA84_13445 [Gemmatimonadaceae bacterium]|nr:hypothetical protein [Gemmatimonadaceae bacterium]